ncbi:DUF3618 domain-containing protein [Actinomadura miaoliensis]|uniref:DUF3618 domain-containing protein n=1 Tax=Actinomadura miaoliensis TaxID=430685 RepID=A0ABP7UZZ8_9ACTN
MSHGNSRASAARGQATEKATPNRGAGRSKDRQTLEADIEQTRQGLSETVDALMRKVDVPARARDKAEQLREQAAGTFGTLTRTVRHKAPQARQQVAVPVTKAAQAIPEPVRRTTARTSRKTVQTVGERPEALVAAVAVCAGAGVWLWRRGSRS